jgi:hypothetical protein
VFPRSRCANRTVAFNTAHHGYAPTGVNGPWNSLNVGVKTFGEPAHGVDVEPDSAFMNSSAGSMYKDGGVAGVGTLRDDVGGWHNLAPVACFGATCSIEGPGATPTPTATAIPTSIESHGYAALGSLTLAVRRKAARRS